MAYCALVGCSDNRNVSLNILEHFTDTNPDSVYSALIEMQPEVARLDKSEKMLHGLLRLKCQNALDLPFDSMDSIESIADFYDKNGPYSQNLLSHYLLGRAYFVSGDELMALNTFNQCLSIRQIGASKEDFIQLAKVHSQLAEIYRNQKLALQELQELENAKLYSLEGKDTLLATIFEGLKVSPYYKLSMKDSVLAIVERVQKVYKIYGMDDMAADIVHNAIPIYIERNELVSAKKYIDIFEHESGLFDFEGNIENDREIYYYIKGQYYQKLGIIDSAEWQYRHLLEHDNDINNIEAGYKGLLSIYRNKNNVDSIGKYADLYCEVNDTVHARALSNEIARLKAMYDFTHYQMEAEELKIEMMKARHRNIIICIFFIFFLLATSYLIYRERRKKKLEIDRLFSEYDRTLRIINELKGDKEKMMLVHKQELENITGVLKNKGINISNDDSFNLDEELINKFKCVAEKGNREMSISIEDWQSLLHSLTEVDSKFMLFLMKSNLSENEKRIAALIRLHFGDYEIKNIIDSYGSSLPNYKARINKKLFNQDGAKTLRRYIYSWKGKE